MEIQHPPSHPGGAQNVVANAGMVALTPGVWWDWAALQQKKAMESAWLFQAPVEHQKMLLEQLLTTLTQTNARLWDQVTRSLQAKPGMLTGTQGNPTPDTQPIQQVVHVQKMTPTDVPETFLTAFERTANLAGWPQEQWVFIFIPCLTGLVQQVINTLPAANLVGWLCQCEGGNSTNHQHQPTNGGYTKLSLGQTTISRSLVKRSGPPVCQGLDGDRNK